MICLRDTRNTFFVDVCVWLTIELHSAQAKCTRHFGQGKPSCTGLKIKTCEMTMIHPLKWYPMTKNNNFIDQLCQVVHTYYLSHPAKARMHRIIIQLLNVGTASLPNIAEHVHSVIFVNVFSLHSGWIGWHLPTFKHQVLANKW